MFGDDGHARQDTSLRVANEAPDFTGVGLRQQSTDGCHEDDGYSERRRSVTKRGGQSDL